jgi:hypothetical protein
MSGTSSSFMLQRTHSQMAAAETELDVSPILAPVGCYIGLTAFPGFGRCESDVAVGALFDTHRLATEA